MLTSAPPRLDLAYLRGVCVTLHDAAKAYWAQADTCIASAAALHAVLTALGIPAEVQRVSSAVFPAHRQDFGCSIGGEPDGTRRPSAPGYWHGHLVTIAAGRWLLDSTLDQVNAGNPLLAAEPFVGELPYGWTDRAPLYGLTGSMGTWVRYRYFPRQVGWKSAPAWRPSHWRDVADVVLEALAAP